jgi:ABC-type transporter Mla subunit MlaD
MEVNRFKIGLFMLVGTGLLVGCLFLFGVREVFQPKFQFYTYFDESVQGLEEGSPVKFRGVQIGKIDRISITPESLIRVDMSALHTAIEDERINSDTGLREKEEFFYEWIDTRIDAGVRCQLTLTGITGMKYIELNTFDPETETEIVAPNTDRGFFPAAKSSMATAMLNLHEALDRIARVDYEGVTAEFRRACETLADFPESPKVSKLLSTSTTTLEKIGTSADHVRTLLNKEDLDRMSTQVNEALAEIEKLTAALNKGVQDADIQSLSTSAKATLNKVGKAADDVSAVRAELKASLEKFDQAATSVGDSADTFKAASTKVTDTLDGKTHSAQQLKTLSAEAEKSLEELERTLRSLRILVEYLERDPSAILRGKKQ